MLNKAIQAYSYSFGFDFGYSFGVVSVSAVTGKKVVSDGLYIIVLSLERVIAVIVSFHRASSSALCFLAGPSRAPAVFTRCSYASAYYPR